MQGKEQFKDLNFQNIRTTLHIDIVNFAGRVLRGEGKPEEVAMLPKLLMWYDGMGYYFPDN